MGQSLPQEIDLSPETSPACLEVTPDGCPWLRGPDGLLPLNGEVALGYLQLGYWPIPIVRRRDNRWIPAIPWKPFQRRAPTKQEIPLWFLPSSGRSPPHPNADLQRPGGTP